MHRAFILLLGCLMSLSTGAQDPLTKGGIVLLQPESVIQARVSSVALLAAYIGAVQSAASEVLAGSKEPASAAGFLVVAVRPGQGSNAWLDFTPRLSSELEASIVGKIEQVPPPSVREGPIVFAAQVGVWGAEPPTGHAPAPLAWKAVVQRAGAALEVGQTVELAWHER